MQPQKPAQRAVYLAERIVIGGLLLASRLLRAYMLMYGKRPGFKDIWHSLKQA